MTSQILLMSFKILIVVSETCQTENEQLYVGIQHIEFIANCRHKKRGGRVGLYVHENLRYKMRPDLDLFCNCLKIYL